MTPASARELERLPPRRRATASPRPTLLPLAIAVPLSLAAAVPSGAYPIAEERRLGEEFALKASAALPLVREPSVVEFVDRMGRQIVAELGSPQPFEYRFEVVRDGQMNAFAVPGGFVFLHTGTLLRAERDAELAGVLAHEIAHVHAHHIVRQQEKSQLASYASIAGLLLSVIQPAAGAAAMGASAAAQLHYLREFEQEADYLGLRFLRAAGFDPKGLRAFLGRIAAETRGAAPVELPPYLLTHPVTDRRIANLDAIMKDLPPWEGTQGPTPEFRRVQVVAATLTGDAERVRRASGEDVPEPERLATRGLTELYRGEAAAAREHLEAAIAAGAAPGLERWVGLAAFRAGAPDEALRILRGRVEAAPDDRVARLWLGTVLVRGGAWDEAETHLRRVLAEAPWLEAAEQELGQALGRSGRDGLGFYHLARAAELRGDVERALADYERAREKLPEESPEARRAASRIEALRDVRRSLPRPRP